MCEKWVGCIYSNTTCIFKKQKSLTHILKKIKKEKGLITTLSLCLTPDVGLILPVMTTAKYIGTMVIRDTDTKHQLA